MASRFNVNRTVDGATPTRRAISLSPTPAVLKRSTSRTWRIVVLSAGTRSPMQKPKERTLIGPAEAPLNRARSSRNAERDQIGMLGYIIADSRATSLGFRSLIALNEQLLEGCRRRLGDRLRGHDETIGERLVRDLTAFHTLPPAPYDACEKKAGRVSSLSLVRYRC